MICSRCGAKLRGPKGMQGQPWIYSRVTRARYCLDLDACDRRARKRRKAAAPQ